MREQLFSKGSGYLLYKIVDDSFDYCFPMLRKIGNKLERIEEEIFQGRAEEVVRDISNAKQEIINFRKIIRPQRAVLRDLERTKQRYLADDLDIYFDDIVDASERIWDMLENYKEVVEALEDTNESVLSHRVNEVLRVLTAFSVVILPLTLIASIWGMNVGVPGEGTVGAVLGDHRRDGGCARSACSATSAGAAGSDRRVPIAGAHGQIARRLARLLAERGDEVVGLIRNPDHAEDVRADGAEPVADRPRDRRPPSRWPRPWSGADAVVFAAGAGPGSGAERKLTVDREGAVKLLDGARSAGVPRYLIVSSVGAESPPDGRRRLQRLPACEGRGRRCRGGQRPRLDDRSPRRAHRRSRDRARAHRSASRSAPRSRATTWPPRWLQCSPSRGAPWLTIYLANGDEPIAGALEAAVRVGLMIEGQEDVTWEDWQALARACEEHGYRVAVPLRPLPLGRRPRRARLARRLGHDQRACGGPRAASGSARWSRRRPSATPRARQGRRHRRSRRRAGAWSSGSAPAGCEAEHEAYGFPFPPIGRAHGAARGAARADRAPWGDDGPILAEAASSVRART